MKIKEIDEMDWKKQIEKLEDELQKLTEKENRIAERKKEVGEKLRKHKKISIFCRLICQVCSDYI